MLAKQKNLSQFQDVSLFQVTLVILCFLSSLVYSVKHQAKLSFVAWISELQGCVGCFLNKAICLYIIYKI